MGLALGLSGGARGDVARASSERRKDELTPDLSSDESDESDDEASDSDVIGTYTI